LFGRPDASFVIETNGSAADGHVTPIDDSPGDLRVLAEVADIHVELILV
jgi:hypothetical protein